MKVLIKKISLSEVHANDKILYNTNNYPYSDTQKQPPDYHEKNDLGNTKNWIDLFHKDNYKTIILDENSPMFRHTPRSHKKSSFVA